MTTFAWLAYYIPGKIYDRSRKFHCYFAILCVSMNCVCVSANGWCSMCVFYTRLNKVLRFITRIHLYRVWRMASKPRAHVPKIGKMMGAKIMASYNINCGYGETKLLCGAGAAYGKLWGDGQYYVM